MFHISIHSPNETSQGMEDMVANAFAMGLSLGSRGGKGGMGGMGPY